MNVKQKVLIVDDEARNQRIISETLEDVAELRQAYSGEEGLRVMETFQPDLLFLDIMMPGMDGYEVCKQLRADPRFTLTKIILVSGKAMIDERLKGYAVGADDYMTKPFVPDELLAKAKVFMRLTQVERELSDINRSLDEKVKERTQQLVNAEAKLVTTAKMSALGEMAGGIAHEINTPLGTISLLVEQLEELIEDEVFDRKAAIEAARIIGKTVARVSVIIQGLRTFSRDGNQDRFESVPLTRILENTFALCRERLKHANIHLKVEAVSEDVRVLCRPVQISQVLLNLLGNACDAVSMLPEKWIKISVERRSDAIHVSVTDSGAGVPEEIRGKIFQPFFTTKDVGSGTGLGLSICKGIMDAHRGTLGLDSSASNTCFVLGLPEGSVST